MTTFEPKKPSGMSEEARQNTKVPKLSQTLTRLPSHLQSSSVFQSCSPEEQDEKNTKNPPPNTASQREAPKAVTE